jgi:hypothetical protein
MHINILNRKSCKIQRVKLNRADLEAAQTLTLAVIADSNRYALSLCADSQADIDLVFNAFNNVPVPSSPDTKRAIWTGDMAAFIIMNYPKEN